MKPNEFNLECQAVGNLLVAFASHELDPERHSQLETHLQGCSRCQLEFQSIRETRHLAGQIRLICPEVDRYPEFLKRLSASEATRSQAALETITRPNTLDQPSTALPENVGGFAAVVPFFGRRLAVRSGFQRGFDLTVQDRTGKELFKVAATSLTRVATVAVGFSFAAGIAITAMIFVFLPMINKPAPPSQGVIAPNPTIGGGVPASQPLEAGFIPPIQTATAGGKTLAVWQSSRQLFGQLFEPLSAQPMFEFPQSPQSNRPQPPRPAGTATTATDGEGFVTLASDGTALAAWYLDLKAPGPRPSVRISEAGMNPALTWLGNRYLAVWIKPDFSAPELEGIELDKTGQPLSGQTLILARSNPGNKISHPRLATAGKKVAVTYRSESGDATVLLFDPATGSTPVNFLLPRSANAQIDDARVFPAGDEFLIVWSEGTSAGSRLCGLKVGNGGISQAATPLVNSPQFIAEFTLLLEKNRFTAVWLEGTGGQKQILAQPFDNRFTPLSVSRVLVPETTRPVSFAPALANNSHVLWMGASGPNQPPQMKIQPLQ
ncbi:MAG: zf-HC2 domain-containing protein [Blastocatellia bacterium]|nr:zf-HC2 domain-containing protein [Blastocatellia bacterium]